VGTCSAPEGMRRGDHLDHSVIVAVARVGVGNLNIRFRKVQRCTNAVCRRIATWENGSRTSMEEKTHRVQRATVLTTAGDRTRRSRPSLVSCQRSDEPRREDFYCWRPG